MSDQPTRVRFIEKQVLRTRDLINWACCAAIRSARTSGESCSVWV
jgi:hypothetical protein